MVIKNKTQFLLTALIIAASFFIARNSQATVLATLRGSAWWGSNQYLYFNCLDNNSGDLLDDPYNLCGGQLKYFTNPLFCGTGDYVFHFSSAACSSLSYGVYLDSSGNFSGQAWNNTKGLVNFYATTTPPDGNSTITGCQNTCSTTSGCSACYNENTQQVHGWVRIVNDGTWIKLDTPLDYTGSASTTGVQIQSWNTASSTYPYYSLSPGDFIGDATTTSSSLSFNCLSEGGKTGGGTCGTRNYKVYIGNLQIGHLTAPNWSAAQACGNGALQAVLTWNVKSGSAINNSNQAGYEVVVNNVNSFSTSSGNYVCWSGVKSPSVATQYILPSSDCHGFAYNTAYYWWIRLFDTSGSSTPWYQFGLADGHNGLLDTHTNSTADPSQTVFMTYKHEFPESPFSWSPTPVLTSTTTNFTSSAVYYTTAAPSSTPQTCNSANCHYLWSTTDAYASATSWTTATTSIMFQQATGTSVTLSLTDNDNYVCSTSTTFSVNYELPLWREIKAQ
jgi:hypothetical protein